MKWSSLVLDTLKNAFGKFSENICFRKNFRFRFRFRFRHIGIRYKGIRHKCIRYKGIRDKDPVSYKAPMIKHNLTTDLTTKTK